MVSANDIYGVLDHGEKSAIRPQNESSADKRRRRGGSTRVTQKTQPVLTSWASPEDKKEALVEMKSKNRENHALPMRRLGE